MTDIKCGAACTFSWHAINKFIDSNQFREIGGPSLEHLTRRDARRLKALTFLKRGGSTRRIIVNRYALPIRKVTRDTARCPLYQRAIVAMPEMIETSAANSTELRKYRPSILATPFVRSGHGEVLELLSSAEQEALARVAQLMRIKKRTTLYPEGGDARFVYNVIEGVVGTYHLLPGGERLVTAFLFPGDLLGMSENGKYVATAQTISNVVAWRIAIPDLESVLQRDPQLDIGLLTKLCHDIRSAYRHTVDVSKNDASSRVAAFLLWIESIPGAKSLDGNLELPMAWHEVADYLALSTEAVSRALQRLESAGAISRSRPRTIAVLDHAALVRVAESGGRK